MSNHTVRVVLTFLLTLATIGCGGATERPSSSDSGAKDAATGGTGGVPAAGSGGTSGAGTGGTGTGGSAGQPGQDGSAGRDVAPVNDGQSTDRPDVGGSEVASLDASSEIPSSVADGSDTTPETDGGVDSDAGGSSQGDGNDAQNTSDGGSSLAPGTYAVNVTRDDSDLYRVTNQSTWIKTQFCFQFVYFDAATLIWNGKFSIGNKITFSSGQSCDVVDVLVGNKPA